MVEKLAVEMEGCPKYESCASPLCPMDTDLVNRDYLDGEPVCFYVRRYVKGCSGKCNGSEEEILRVIARRLPELIFVGGSRYKRRLERASRQGSRKAPDQDLKCDRNYALRGDIRGALSGE